MTSRFEFYFNAEWTGLHQGCFKKQGRLLPAPMPFDWLRANGIREQWADSRIRCTAVRNKYVVPADAGIQRLKSLDSSQKHAGMTVSERLFEFKSVGRLTMCKAAWYARMRHVRDYYSGQQFTFAGMMRLIKTLDTHSR